jgi:hypothetical protein
MYGILAEDESDAEMLSVIIRRIAKENVSIDAVGFGGGGDLLKHGAKRLKLMHRNGRRRFVICHDADELDCAARYAEIEAKIVKESGVNATICVLIPREEIESWILADLAAVSNVLKSFRPQNVFAQPEHIQKPKERLEKLCRVATTPRYTHAVHNPKVAKFLNREMVERKCPSFLPLRMVVEKNESSVAPAPIN